MGTKKYAPLIKEENKLVINRHKDTMNRLILEYKAKEK